MDLKWPTLGHERVSHHEDHHWLSYTIASGHFVQNQTDTINRTQGTWQRPLFGHKWPILGPAKYFSALWPAGAARCHNFLSWYTKPAISNAFWTKNSSKPHFGPLFDPNWPIIGLNNFFLENQASSLFYTHRRLTCCKKSEKSYGGKYENFDGTDWRTDWLTELILEDPSVGPIRPSKSTQLEEINRPHFGPNWP